MVTHVEQAANTDNYLPALIKLAENTITATQQATVLYQQHHLILEPEDFISFLCRWLSYIINQKITGDKEFLFKLVRDTINQHVEQGSELCQIVRTQTEQGDSQVDALIKTHGLIVVPTLKLIQYISNVINQAFNHKKRSYTLQERAELENFLDNPLNEIFENAFQSTVLAINELQIANPLVFLLEHLSAIDGWITGFFAKLSNKPAELFFANGFNYLKEKVS